MEVLVEDEGDSPYKQHIHAWALRALREEGLPESCELGVLIVGPGRMAELNLAHRGMSSPTDVLSFPMYESKESLLADSETIPPGQPLLIGDIVICPEVAAENAKEDGHTVERELCLLVVHGVLHLLSYEHEGEDPSSKERAAHMDARQAELVKVLAAEEAAQGEEK